MDFFSSFLILVFFRYPSFFGGEIRILVRNGICWNISACNSYIEEMSKTGISIEIPKICKSLFSEKTRLNSSSSRSQSKAFYLYKEGIPFKNLCFCSLRQNPERPVMKKVPLFFETSIIKYFTSRWTLARFVRSNFLSIAVNYCQTIPWKNCRFCSLNQKLDSPKFPEKDYQFWYVAFRTHVSR